MERTIDPQFEGMYNRYALHLKVDRLVGGIPKHPDIVRRWQEARMPVESKKPEGLTVESATAETVEALGDQALDPDEETKSVWTGFVQDPVSGNLALESRNIVAMLKESSNIMKDHKMMKKLTGDKKIALRARVAERVFVFGTPVDVDNGVFPTFINLGVKEPESLERPIHVMTARGQRTALKKTDYLDHPEFDMELWVLDDGVITEDILRLTLEHAAWNGLGTDRSQGNGMFDYTLNKIS